MQSAQELEIPLGTIFSFLSRMLAKAKNPRIFDRCRNHDMLPSICLHVQPF